MKKINISFLEALKLDRVRRLNMASSIPQLIRECRKSLLNFYYLVTKLSVIELSSIILSLERWMSVKGTMNKGAYKVRDIVGVDLGLGYGYEMSYRHPCIVLYDSNAGFCLVVPCSTGKYGKGNKFIIDGTPTDGFRENTGVLIDAVRCVSKTRINSKVGEITVSFLERLNNIIIHNYFPRHFHRLHVLKNELEAERLKIKELESKLVQ